MTPPRHTLLHITPASSTAPLTPQQKKFNSHMKRIAAQRQWLTDWELAVQAYRTRHDAELRPLLESVRQRHAELVRVLDAAHDRKGLSKAQRAALSEALADRAAELIDDARNNAEDAELKAIYNRHAPSDYDSDLAEGEKAGEAMARQMAEEILGVDLEGVDLQDEEALMRHLQAHHEREQQRQAAQGGQRRPRKPTARERKEQETAEQFGYSLLTQPKPASLMGLLREQLQLLRHESFQLERQIRALRDDPQALKPWLKAEQQRLRESEEAFDPWF